MTIPTSVVAGQKVLDETTVTDSQVVLGPVGLEANVCVTLFILYLCWFDLSLRLYFNLHQLILDPLVPGTMPPHPMKVCPLHNIPYRKFTISTFSDNDLESEDNHDYLQKGKMKHCSQMAQDRESSYHFDSSTLFLRHAKTLRVLYMFLTTH